MDFRKGLVVLAALAAVAGGCGDDGGGGGHVETILETVEAAAGEPVGVACRVFDGAGNLTDDVGVIRVEPDAGVAVAVKSIVVKTAGEYLVTCHSADESLADESPAELLVIPAAAAVIRAELGADSIPAGGSTTASCIVEDGFGNAVPEPPETAIVLPPELTLAGEKVGGTVAGIYQVDCALVGDGEPLTSQPAALAVTPLAASAFVLALVPAKTVYALAEEIAVESHFADQYGNLLPGSTPGAVSYAPKELVTVVDERTFSFKTEGLVTLSACDAVQGNLCGQLEARSDGTGPVITITQPARGAMLSEAPVAVSGTAVDALGVAVAVSVNGVEVQLGEGGAFLAEVAPGHALNLLEVTATDDSGNESTGLSSFLYSTHYRPIASATPATALISRALELYADDQLFYSTTPGNTENLSHLVNVLLANLDIGSMLPNPVATDQDLSVLCLWDKFDIFVTNINYGKPSAQLLPVPGGLSLLLTIPNFSADFSVTTDGFLCASYDGHINADAVVLTAKIKVAKDDEGGLVVTVPETEVTFEELDIDLGGIPGTLLNWALDLFSGTIAGMLEKEFKKMIVEMVEELTGDLTAKLKEPVELPLDPFVAGNDPMTLKLLLRFAEVTFDTWGGLLAANVAIVADQVVPGTFPGALGRASCLSATPEEFYLSKSGAEPIELAAHIDLVNEALYSLWLNGGLHLTVTSEALAEMGTDVGKYGVSNLVLETAPLLPPVLTTCTADGRLLAQLGDFYAEADLDMLGIPTDFHFYLFLALKADLGIVEDEEGKKIGLVIDEPEYVRVEIVHVNEQWHGKESMLTGLITETLVPQLLKGLKEKPIAFALPAINLGGLLGGDEPTALDGKELAIEVRQLDLPSGRVHALAGIKVQDAPPEEEGE